MGWTESHHRHSSSSRLALHGTFILILLVNKKTGNVQFLGLGFHIGRCHVLRSLHHNLAPALGLPPLKIIWIVNKGLFIAPDAGLATLQRQPASVHAACRRPHNKDHFVFTRSLEDSKGVDFGSDVVQDGPGGGVGVRP